MSCRKSFAPLFILLFIAGPAITQQQNLFSENVRNNETDLHLREVNAKHEDSTYLESAIPVEQFGGDNQHFPYPVIFVHGLTGSSETWQEFYDYAINQGWNFGGQLLFNLNSDNDHTYANVYNGGFIDLVDFNINIGVGDFYVINFNCSVDGVAYGGDYSEPSKSNQSAIVKQSLAIRNAINHVTVTTGKNKVILFGHSMGGLASRHYLQNTNFWQADGHHHIAKLITSGTPHGGSNATGTFMSEIFTGIDERSDAVRDLRESYFYSGNAGVLLFGGLESPDVIHDNLLGFYNYDVSCDGQSGGFYQGLNNLEILYDLDYSNIIGDWFWDIGGVGDGVVAADNAQLKNYFNLTSETFWIESNTLTERLHTHLTEYTEENYLALDEPDYYDLAYEIEVGSIYNGFKTIQADDAEYATDYDDYVLNIPQDGWIRLWTLNNSTSTLGLGILDETDFSIILNEEYGMGEALSAPMFVEAGSYLVEYYSAATAADWQYPYAFEVIYSANDPTAIKDRAISGILSLGPNPTQNELNLQLTDFNQVFNKIEIISVSGQLVLLKEITIGHSSTINVDVSKLAAGSYVVRLIGDEYSLVEQFVKN